LKWVPEKREVEERMGQNDKREEGKLMRRRRQCKVRGGTHVLGRGKNGEEDKRKDGE
jgi:hypothetical protein